MQSNIDQRIMLSSSGGTVFTDLTIALNEWNNGRTSVITMVPGDYLYVASFLPFNNKYFRFYTPSTIARTPIIEVLDAPNEWNQVVDCLDYSAGFTASGVVQWTPNYDKSWALVGNSSIDVPALASAPTIYGAFWMRIRFAATCTFTLEYVGQKFSSDVDLYQEYPILQQPTLLGGWKSGKTNWDDQHLLAASYISKIMVQRGIIFTNNQILDISTLRNPAVHKAAHIIYSGLGAKNYEAEILLASSNFETAMTQKNWQVDVNGNARKDRGETVMDYSRATR